MQSIEVKSQIKIANSSELNELINLSPKIMNHDILRGEDYDPSYISTKLEGKAQEEHRKFINAYKRFQEEKNSELLDALIKKLAQLLYIVRSNIAHGEKTPKGPDKEKVNRDKRVCETVYPILYNILKEIFDNPNSRLILYGTMRKGEVNHSVLQEIKGKFIKGKIEGAISIINGLPYFEWRTNTSFNDIDVFISDELENHWNDLDRFEGDSYRRIWIPFKLSNGFSIGNVYGKND